MSPSSHIHVCRTHVHVDCKWVSNSRSGKAAQKMGLRITGSKSSETTRSERTDCPRGVVGMARGEGWGGDHNCLPKGRG